MSSMAEAPPTRRRWFQISLGTMLVAITIIGILAARVAWNERHERERFRLLATEGVSFDHFGSGDEFEMERIREIDVSSEVSDDVFKRMQIAFPEAEVRRGSGGTLPYILSTFTNTQPLVGPAKLNPGSQRPPRAVGWRPCPQPPSTPAGGSNLDWARCLS
jgi:hypothetical protein